MDVEISLLLMEAEYTPNYTWDQHRKGWFRAMFGAIKEIRSEFSVSQVYIDFLECPISWGR